MQQTSAGSRRTRCNCSLVVARAAQDSKAGATDVPQEMLVLLAVLACCCVAFSLGNSKRPHRAMAGKTFNAREDSGGSEPGFQ